MFDEVLVHLLTSSNTCASYYYFINTAKYLFGKSNKIASGHSLSSQCVCTLHDILQHILSILNYDFENKTS